MRTLDVLPAAERTLLLETWNATQMPYPSEQCIHALFEAQVARTPEAIAVVQGEVALTYAELNAQANRLAHRLIALGVGPDRLVGLCVERRPHLVIGVLAILKAGGAYVPLDPSYPRERLQELVSDAAPVVVVADAAGRQALALETDTPVVSVDEPAPWSHERDSNPQVAGLSSRQLAYVIYTSGSTGTPKGVMVEHAQIVRLFEATEAWYGFTERDVWCSVPLVRVRLLGVGAVGRVAVRRAAGDRAAGDRAEPAGALRAGVRGGGDGAQPDAERVPGLR